MLRQPRRRSPYHSYYVFVTFYADEGIKAGVESGQDFITQPDQLTTQQFYSGSSERQAGYAFYRATLAAMKNPLALSVLMWKDDEVVADVKIMHRR